MSHGPYEFVLYSPVRPATLDTLSHISPIAVSDNPKDAAGYVYVVYAEDMDAAKTLAVAETLAPNGYTAGVRCIWHRTNGEVKPAWRKPWSGVAQKYNAE
jgi:hypothetical protein